MSKSYSSDSDENISFNNTPIIAINNFSVGSEGSVDLGNHTVEKNCDYFKLVCGLTVSDTSISSESGAAVCVVYTINYTDENNQSIKITDTFYPRFKHENDNVSDFTIIEAPGVVDSIDIFVINNEAVQVNVSDFNVYYAEHVVVDGESVANAINEYTNNGGTFNLVIPLVSSLPPIESVPDGYVCRLISLS